MTPFDEADEILVKRYGGYRGILTPVMTFIQGNDAQSTINFAHCFFIADRDYQVLSVRERHEQAASDGSLDVLKTKDGILPSAGLSLLSSEIDLTATASTFQDGLLTETARDLVLADGEALSMKANGTLSSLRNVCLQIILRAL